MSHVLDVGGHRLRESVGTAGAWPGGLQDRGLCLLARELPLAIRKHCLLAGTRASSFWCVTPPGSWLWLVAAVTPCVGLSEGFLELFGACCHGSQLQSLVGHEARQEGGGGMCPPAGSRLWGPRRPGAHSFLLGRPSRPTHCGSSAVLGPGSCGCPIALLGRSRKLQRWGGS